MKRRDASISQNYTGLFEEREVHLVEKLVREAKSKSACLNVDDPEDLIEECLIHWLDKKVLYDVARKAALPTFMATVVRNFLLDMVRKRLTDKRKANYEAESLDAPLTDEDEPPTLHDRLSEADIPQVLRPGQSPPSLRTEIEKTLSELGPQQAEVCRLIMDEGLTVTEISKTLGVPRSTIYDQMARMKRLFERGGLRDYLEK